MPVDDGALLAGDPWLVRDEFDKPVGRGHVVGSAGTRGQPRRGTDVEGVLSIDHGALRLSPLIVPGWGRVALAHGPLPTDPGLGASVLMLNAHNAADTLPMGPFLRRVVRWLLGNEVDRLPTRLIRWPGAPRREPVGRRLRRWRHRQGLEGATPDENLAVGLFASPAGGPAPGDQAFVVRTAGPANGQLTVQVSGTALPVVESLQNVPFLYVALVTETGTLYAVSSLSGAAGAAGYPLMRPLAIDPSPPPAAAHLGVHQRVVDQEGFSSDTRVFAVRAAHVPEAATWCSTAASADRLTGRGALAGRTAERGGAWQVDDGELELHADGAGGQGTALLATSVDVGLAKVTLDLGAGGRAGLAWRCDREQELSEVVLDRGTGSLRVAPGEGPAQEAILEPAPSASTTLQLRATGQGVAIVADGRELLRVPGLALPGPGGQIGVTVGSGARASDFEVHATSVPVPALLGQAPPCPSEGGHVVVDEPFSSAAHDLDGYARDGDATWSRTSGTGRFEVDPEVGARAVGSVASPVAGRTAYTVAWPEPGGADVAVTICPPGGRRGEGHACRAGLVFVQDDRNQLLVNTWLADDYGGASISVFPRVAGLEDVYDAVWTNVGDRISWGRPYELRVAFDGVRFLASVDGEPVLYRAISDLYPSVESLQVTRVGIVTNWEWGLDTGSTFRRFTARALRAPGCAPRPVPAQPARR